MAVDLIDVAATFNKKTNNNKHLHDIASLYSEKARYLIIRLPNSRSMKICFRFLLLAFALFSFQLIAKSSLINIERFSSTLEPVTEYKTEEVLSTVFRDLTNEGLMKKKTEKQNAIFLSNEEGSSGSSSSQVFTDHNMHHIPLKNMEKQSYVPDNSVDFVFTSDFLASSQFIERVLKIGGVCLVLVNDNNPSTGFYKPSNYRIAYIRRFDSVAVAMKKTSSAAVEKEPKFTALRKLCGSAASEAKKAALQNLEDVLLEPPRAASGKSRKYLKRTKYLPDLMGDSLQGYPRRVFIDVGLPEKEGGSGSGWFVKNYPTRNTNFEMYKIETVTEVPSTTEVAQIGMSDWLRKNVREEEYVVMKAEAEVVEEMVKSNSIGLVDELFLECKPHGPEKGNRTRRAYWQCLALYGKLRDEGVAVHQWWG